MTLSLPTRTRDVKLRSKLQNVSDLRKTQASDQNEDIDLTLRNIGTNGISPYSFETTIKESTKTHAFVDLITDFGWPKSLVSPGSRLPVSAPQQGELVPQTNYTFCQRSQYWSWERKTDWDQQPMPTIRYRRRLPQGRSAGHPHTINPEIRFFVTISRRVWGTRRTHTS